MAVYLSPLFHDCLENLRKINVGQIVPDEKSYDITKFNPLPILDQLNQLNHELSILEEELARISNFYRSIFGKLAPFSKLKLEKISLKLINAIIRETLSKVDETFGQRSIEFQGNQIKKVHGKDRSVVEAVRQAVQDLQQTIVTTKIEYKAIRVANPENKLLTIAPLYGLGHFEALITKILAETEAKTRTDESTPILLSGIITSFGELLQYSKALRKVLQPYENDNYTPLILAVCKLDKNFEAKLKQAGIGDATKGYTIDNIRYALIYMFKIYLKTIAGAILSINNKLNLFLNLNQALKSDITETFKLAKNVHFRAAAICLKYQVQNPQNQPEKIIYYIPEPYFGADPDLIASIGYDKAEFLRRTFEMPIVSLLAEDQGLSKFRQLIHNQFFLMIKSKYPQIKDENARMFIDNKCSRLDTLSYWSFIAYLLFLTDVRNIELWKNPARRGNVLDKSKCVFRTYSVDYGDIYSGIFYIKGTHDEDYTWRDKITPTLQNFRGAA